MFINPTICNGEALDGEEPSDLGSAEGEDGDGGPGGGGPEDGDGDGGVQQRQRQQHAQAWNLGSFLSSFVLSCKNLSCL